MKKFVFGPIMAMLCLMGTGIVTSCDKTRQALSTNSVDSVKVYHMIDEYHNPQFSDATEFCNYASEEVGYYDFVETARSLHRNTIEAITNACIKNYGYVDYLLFMQEYREHEVTYVNVDNVNWKSEGLEIQQINCLAPPPSNTDTLTKQKEE